MIDRFIRLFRFAGPIGILFSWAVILASISINPWFRITEHAYSDLGGKYATHPEVFNFGLITTGLLMLLFSLALLYYSRDKLSTVGSSWLIISSFFLALIGVFPTGTRHHVFVSTWFFIQVWLSMLPNAISFYMGKDRLLGKYLLMLFVISPTAAVAVEAIAGWPSVALLETYGIALIDVYVILLYFKYFIKRSIP